LAAFPVRVDRMMEHVDVRTFVDHAAPDRREESPVKIVGNILWFVFAGLWLAIGYIVSGLIQCVTVVGIPFGIQSFKLAGFVLWPFGRAIVKRQDSNPGLRTVGNFLWFIFSGLWLAIGHAVAGVLLCVTVIGIPFGLVCFRMIGLALMPFGKEIVDVRSAPAGAEVFRLPGAEV
jgi:uncharacterized membrane protein YccF (DUF307 family)